MYGQRDRGEPISSSVLSRVNAAFRPRDESICVWAAPGSPNVLRISADVSAGSDQDAIAQAAYCWRTPPAPGALSLDPPVI